MNKTLKYATSLGTATVALAFAVTVASADSSIVNSGNNANVNTSSNSATSVNVTNSNSAFTSQTSVGVSNTGGNFTSGNIGGGSVATGAATTSSEQEVMANQNQTGIALPATHAAGSNDADVVNTGNNLDLNNSVNSITGVTAVNVNKFVGNQQSIGISNSGLNGASGNIGGGSIATGAARVTSGLNAEANVNETLLNLGSLGASSGNGLTFTNTGNGANVNNSTNVVTGIFALNSNMAIVNQSSFGLSNSGLNFTDGNIGSGSIATGSAAVNSAFDVMANKNSTGIAFGSSAGTDAEGLDITNTGNNLDVNGSTNVFTSVTAASTNASATAQASVDVSNSGLNFGLGNIGGGALGTGNAGVWTGFMAGGNWNQTLID